MEFFDPRGIWRKRRTYWEEAKALVTLGCKRDGLFLVGGSVGFTADAALSTKQDAESCATAPQKLSKSKLQAPWMMLQSRPPLPHC